MARRIRRPGQKLQQQPSRRPMGHIIAEAAGVNVNTIYDLAKHLNEYIEVKRTYPNGR